MNRVRNNTTNNNFSLKIKLLWSLIKERFNTIKQKNGTNNIISSLKLICDFFNKTFNNAEKLIVFVSILFIYFLVYFICDLFSFASIDKALNSLESIKAQEMIEYKMFFMRNNKSLKLRLAHSYLGLDREREAERLINQVLQTEPNNKYLPKVIIALSQNLNRKGQITKAIDFLERVDLKHCSECRIELLNLYTLQGRHYLTERIFDKANELLSKALLLAQELKLPQSSISYRKNELGRSYNLEAMEILETKPDKVNDALVLLEKSVSLYPDGQTYLHIAKILYKQKDKTLLDIEKNLSYYQKAYSFGLIEPENINNHKQLISLLKKEMKLQNKTDKEIEEKLDFFKLSEGEKIVVRADKEDIQPVHEKRVIHKTIEHAPEAKPAEPEIKKDVPKPVQPVPPEEKTDSPTTEPLPTD